jgi:polysaccharide export outer membrane protein
MSIKSRFRHPLSIAVALAIMTMVPATITGQPAASSDGGLQPGDIVQVTVWQREELSGEFTVAPDGSLNHPLYREVRVTGVPATQIEERLRSFLTAYEANPQVVVQPLYKVTVAGAVMRPDIYTLPPGTTISQAVTQAGGVTEDGKRDDVRLYRSANETRLDITEPEAIGMPIQSGDQILVRDKSSGLGFRSTILPIIQIGFSIAHILIYNR